MDMWCAGMCVYEYMPMSTACMCMCVCVHVCVYVRACICWHVCICMYVCICVLREGAHVHMFACVYVSACVCVMCVVVCVLFKHQCVCVVAHGGALGGVLTHLPAVVTSRRDKAEASLYTLYFFILFQFFMKE